MTEVETAEIIARLAHYGQTTKSEGLPYISHVMAVVGLVPPEYRTVAWLHDVLEDTKITPEALLAAGIKPHTIEIVKLLTRAPNAEFGKGDKPTHTTHPLQSYAEYIDQIILSKSRAAMEVKRADLTHNLRPGCPPSLVPRYLQAKSRIESVLKDMALVRERDREKQPRCGGSGMVAYEIGGATLGEMCPGCQDCEPAR